MNEWIFEHIKIVKKLGDIFKRIFETNKVGRLIQTDFKIYSKATVMKTVWYWHESKYVDQWNRVKNPAIEHIFMGNCFLMNVSV